MDTAAPVTDQVDPLNPVVNSTQNIPGPEPEGGVPDPFTDLLKDDEDKQTVVKNLAKHFIGLDKWVRRQEVIDTRRQRFYWRSDQYIYWKSDAIGFVPATGGATVAIGDGQAEVGRYTDVYNIYTPYGESLIATLIQNPPGVNWQPSDPSDPKDIVAAKAAEKFQQKIEKDNDRKGIQNDVCRFFFTDGRAVLYTRRNKKGFEEITAHGVLETKVCPITSTSQKDLIFVAISDEIDVYQAKDEYPDHAEKIIEGSASLGESSYERIARLGVLQGTRLIMQAGDAFAHMVTRHTVFLRPNTYNKAPKEDRDWLKETFPNGIKSIFCGDTYCWSNTVSMDDQVSIGFPGPGDGMSRPSMGKRLVGIQDVFNDEMNLWHEAHDYCVPTLFMYSETGDIEAVREQISEPGNIIPFTSLPPGASSAADAFFESVLEGVPETLPNLVQFLQGPLAQFISGAFPALFGGDTGQNDTAKGIAIQRDQAMGRMGLTWSSLQQLFSEAYFQAVKSASQYSDEDEEFNYSTMDRSGNVKNQVIPISDLTNGKALCYPNADANFPDSIGAKKATFQVLMTAAERNPALAEIVSQPDNMELGYEWMGLPELVVPGAEARNKQLIEVEQLLNEPPVPPSDQELTLASQNNPQLSLALNQWSQQAQAALQNGQQSPKKPIPPEMYQPSVQVDPIFDFHQYELQTIKDWLSSDAGIKARESNPDGVVNVRLHGIAHQQALAAQAQQAAQQQAQQQPPPKRGQGQATEILQKHTNPQESQGAQ